MNLSLFLTSTNFWVISIACIHIGGGGGSSPKHMFCIQGWPKSSAWLCPKREGESVFESLCVCTMRVISLQPDIKLLYGFWWV